MTEYLGNESFSSAFVLGGILNIIKFFIGLKCGLVSQYGGGFRGSWLLCQCQLKGS